MKKVIKVDFYDQFQCSAKDCPITCCQEWQIEVDESTKKKWEALDLSKLGGSSLVEYVTGTAIHQTEDKQCCFLDENKLCSLVTAFGDDVLSKTCAMFPREAHEFENRIEYTLTACCPEVVELLNQQEAICFTEDLTKIDEGCLAEVRNLLLYIMGKKEIPITKCFMMAFYLLLHIYKQDDLSSENDSDGSFDVEQYKAETLLKELSDAIDNMEFSRLGTLEETNELFLDLVQKYKEEERYGGYLTQIIPVAESIARGYEQQEMMASLDKFDLQFASFESLLRKQIVMELFNSSLVPESKLEGMVVKVQWIALEYAMIKHSIFLQWMIDESLPLEYSVVRDYIVIVSRMMGYDDNGIVEYLNRSFQSLLWEWGYLALIVGRPE